MYPDERGVNLNVGCVIYLESKIEFLENNIKLIHLHTFISYTNLEWFPCTKKDTFPASTIRSSNPLGSVLREWVLKVREVKVKKKILSFFPRSEK